LAAMHAKNGGLIIEFIGFRFQNAHKLVQSAAIWAAKISGWASRHADI